MFYTMWFEEDVKIPLSSEMKEKEVFEVLKRKYVGKIIEGFGICVVITECARVEEYQVYDEFLAAHAKFEMLLFKFFRDEVMYGEILEQNSEGIRVGISFFDEIQVKKDNLAEGSEMVYVSDGGEKKAAWVWIYKGNRFYLRRKSKVRLRVLWDCTDGCVMCDFKEMGLGPIDWWE
ncbi:subunit E' of DNA-directed RNA polymerase [Ordospora colligata]|uniref:Subunit E' of DNA-directed RNA polymerase n=1 Tax=Ordospora colligata OC4 TaxID=1354746 RepID=A0A0B2UIF5_9MICR|nr:subunit E' of DNA-directed RNA polymerase [Ordospora colligata OC4]KHN69138.1 subunit E' of DNA-directed RNA polymerase [Ordospora colligata OC4]TBU14593.1 subunit E' of DNA-directed RNA polymerase [Ordospora colligata]TBU14787.1 subunit E' of DNA-directed RNA polymerase [Ordospora colligata]TBU18221.1 subunit E' of DNA-directed RNA polymerase [Ordospora colligata]